MSTKSQILHDIFELYIPEQFRIQKGQGDEAIWLPVSPMKFLNETDKNRLKYHMPDDYIGADRKIYRMMHFDFDSKRGFTTKSLLWAQKILAALEGLGLKPYVKFSGSTGIHYTMLFSQTPKLASFEQLSRYIFAYVIKQSRFKQSKGAYDLELLTSMRGFYSGNENSGKFMYCIPIEDLSVGTRTILKEAKDPVFHPIELHNHQWVSLPESLEVMRRKSLIMDTIRERNRIIQRDIRDACIQLKDKTIEGIHFHNLIRRSSGRPMGYTNKILQGLVEEGVLELVTTESRITAPIYQTYKIIGEPKSKSEKLFDFLQKNPPRDGRKRLLAMYLVPYLMQDRGLEGKEIFQICVDWVEKTGAKPDQYDRYIKQKIVYYESRKSLGKLKIYGTLKYWKERLETSW